MRLLLPLLALAVVVAGCTSPAQPVQQPPPAGDGDGNGGQGNNTTRQYLPPVARMQVFDTSGALVYESNFVADNATAGSAVQGGGEIRFLASGSTAVDPTATITAWNWAFGDGQRASGRSVTHTFPDTGGVFPVTLTVLDSHGLSDSLVVALGAHATRTFAEPVSGSGTLQAGTLGRLMQDGTDVTTLPLELAATQQGFPVEVEGLVVNLTAGEPTSDFNLFLLDGEGEVVGSSAGQAPGGMEEIRFGPGELAAGSYTLRIVLHAGANASFTLGGEVLYRVVNPQVEEMFGGHQH
jgi:hypothetical protein